MPSPTAAAAKNAGPAYYDLIKEAVISLKERNGSSRQAIDKFVAAKKGDSYTKSRLNVALKRGVESGKLVAIKGSFKLAADEKKVKKTSSETKPTKKAAAPKKSDAKKSTVKKAVTKKPAAKKTASVGKKDKVSKKKTVNKKKTTGKKTIVKKVAGKKPTTTKKKTVKKAPAAAKKAAKKPTVKKD